jgi:hypothetical protein
MDEQAKTHRLTEVETVECWQCHAKYRLFAGQDLPKDDAEAKAALANRDIRSDRILATIDASIGGKPGERRAFTSRMGGWPNKRLYSRLNWLALSYHTAKAALAASRPSMSMRHAPPANGDVSDIEEGSSPSAPENDGAGWTRPWQPFRRCPRSAAAWHSSYGAMRWP